MKQKWSESEVKNEVKNGVKVKWNYRIQQPRMKKRPIMKEGPKKLFASKLIED